MMLLIRGMIDAALAKTQVRKAPEPQRKPGLLSHANIPQELLDYLGVPKHAEGLQLSCEPGKLVTVHVRYTPEEGDRYQLLERFFLVRREGDIRPEPELDKLGKFLQENPGLWTGFQGSTVDVVIAVVNHMRICGMSPTGTRSQLEHLTPDELRRVIRSSGVGNRLYSDLTAMNQIVRAFCEKNGLPLPVGAE